jgi:predicted RNase H-like HicB family nuclease
LITDYIDQALHRANYQKVDEGQFCATVPGLRGVIATGRTLEQCREQLAEVIEEWILVRVAQGLSVPRIGGVTVVPRELVANL